MIDWTNLRHAYGAAGDVPALLDGLTPDPKDEVWNELWSRICHQGSVYSASFAALPVLADVAARWEPKQRTQPLTLAGHILASEDCHDKEGRSLVKAFLQDCQSVVLRLQALCAESLAQHGLPEEDFIYLLQAARTFDGDEFWGRRLDRLAGGEFPGVCPSCGAYLYLAIGEYGYFATSEDWVSLVEGPGNWWVRPHVKRAPIEPLEALPPNGQWMYDRCIEAEQTDLAQCIKYLFGTSTCTACGVNFVLPEAMAKA